MELLVLPAQPQSVLVVGSSQHRALLVSMDSASSDPVSTHKVLLLSTDSDILFNYQFLLLGRWEWPGLLAAMDLPFANYLDELYISVGLQKQ